jgi:hypothetical protein
VNLKAAKSPTSQKVFAQGIIANPEAQKKCVLYIKMTCTTLFAVLKDVLIPIRQKGFAAATTNSIGREKSYGHLEELKGFAALRVVEKSIGERVTAPAIMSNSLRVENFFQLEKFLG